MRVEDEVKSSECWYRASKGKEGERATRVDLECRAEDCSRLRFVDVGPESPDYEREGASRTSHPNMG